MRGAVLALLVVPLVAVACGGGSKHATASAASPLAAVKGALEKTLAAGSESIKLTGGAEASGQTVMLSGTGAFDTKSSNGTLTLHIDAGPLSTSVDEILIGSTIYLRSPVLTGLSSGKSWIKVDMAKLGSLAGVTGALLTQRPVDELKQLQYVKSATRVGVDSIGTQYRAVLDAAKLPRSARGVSSYDVWVGEDGYVHRVRVGAAKPKVSATVDLSNFGGAVHASPPPADQVDASGGLLKGLGG